MYKRQVLETRNSDSNSKDIEPKEKPLEQNSANTESINVSNIDKVEEKVEEVKKEIEDKSKKLEDSNLEEE